MTKDHLAGILWENWLIAPFIESKPLSLSIETTQVLMIDRLIGASPGFIQLQVRPALIVS